MKAQPVEFIVFHRIKCCRSKSFQLNHVNSYKRKIYRRKSLVLLEKNIEIQLNLRFFPQHVCYLKYIILTWTLLICSYDS